MNPARSIFSIAVVLVGGFVLFAWATQGGTVWTAEAARRQQIEATPLALPNVSVQREDGSHTSLLNFDRRIVLADFIFTQCAAVCPALGYRFKQLQQRLADSGHAQNVQLLSVSFDHARDQPQDLQNYLNRFDADPYNWAALRIPDQTALTRILDRLGVVVIPSATTGFVHNTAVYLIEGSKVIGIKDYDDPHLFEWVVARLATSGAS